MIFTYRLWMSLDSFIIVKLRRSCWSNFRNAFIL